MRVHRRTDTKMTDVEIVKKKSRAKIVLPAYQCFAKCANGKQCTRARKPDADFCGTHAITNANMIASGEPEYLKCVEVWIQIVRGIPYFIDKFGNIYSAVDMVSNVENPRRIGKWSRNEDSGEYTIDSLCT